MRVTHTVDKDFHCRRNTLSGMVTTQRFDHLRCIGKRELLQAALLQFFFNSETRQIRDTDITLYTVFDGVNTAQLNHVIDADVSLLDDALKSLTEKALRTIADESQINVLIPFL